MFGPGGVNSVENGEGLVLALVPATAVRGLMLRLLLQRLPLHTAAETAAADTATAASAPIFRSRDRKGVFFVLSVILLCSIRTHSSEARIGEGKRHFLTLAKRTRY